MTSNKIKKVICSCINDIQEKDIQDDTNLKDEYGCTSIKFIQIIAELEGEFGIEINVDDEELPLHKIKMYKELEMLVNKYL